MMVAPLALIGLALGKKKKRGKWDTFIVLLVVGVVVGMSVSACATPVTDSTNGEATGTATIYLRTPTGTATVVASATVKPSITGTALPPADELQLLLLYQCLDNMEQEEPEMPLGLSSDAKRAWDTYVKLWNITEYKYYDKVAKPWWWFEGFNKTESFTPLDYLDRLIQFEFAPIVNRGTTPDERKTLASIGVGNFCFWATRKDNESVNTWQCEKALKDENGKAIFEYIADRKLLVLGKKNWSEPSTWEAHYKYSDRELYELPIAEYLEDIPIAWQDWRSELTPNFAEDDVPVEWGNKDGDFNKEVHDRIKEHCTNFGTISNPGHKYNEVFIKHWAYDDNNRPIEEGSLYVLTYCQKQYYDNDYDPGNYPPNCGHQ